MNSKAFRFVASLVLITFSFEQITLADPLPYLTTSTQILKFGNQTLLIARDENGARTARRFNAEGRVIEEKDELQLLWEGDAGDTGWSPAYLYNNYTTSAALRSWAENDGFKDSGAVPAGGRNLARVLADYSPYVVPDGVRLGRVRTGEENVPDG